MSIDVGTIVKRYDYDEDTVGYLVCDSLQTNESYGEDYQSKLDVCLGVVIEYISMKDRKESEAEVIVTWVHRCRYHTKIGQIVQEGVDPDYLYEVGQL